MEREEIIEGLKRTARGSYPLQTAVSFLAATSENLDRAWMRRSEWPEEVRYWIDWELFDNYGGVLSGGEYATWSLTRSLCEGELCDQLWRLDPARSEAFAQAIAHCREDWSYE